MITNEKKQKRAVMFLLLCLGTSLYATNLPLHVEGNKIKDSDGHVVVLRGVSAMDIGMIKEWYGVTDYIDRLTDPNDTNGSYTGWYTKVISYAVCPNDSHITDSPLVFNPYDEDDPNNELVYDALQEAADYGAEKGVYSIIKLEYHENIADKVAEANAFWSYMAPRFADDGNVLFELFSEPTDSAGSWGVVKNYMQSWVNIVRDSGADNLVLVTGPCWAQQIGPAVLNDNPIEDDNTVYVVHFYGNTWRNSEAWITDQIGAVAPVYPVMDRTTMTLITPTNGPLARPLISASRYLIISKGLV
jgi:endoglucanase